VAFVQLGSENQFSLLLTWELALVFSDANLQMQTAFTAFLHQLAPQQNKVLNKRFSAF
jgi:hypothetical protein